MNPYMQAVKFYENREDFPFFGEALHQTLMNGFVHSTPDFFIMATPVNKDGYWTLSVPTPAAGGPYTLTFTDGKKLQLKKVKN